LDLTGAVERKGRKERRGVKEGGREGRREKEVRREGGSVKARERQCDKRE